MPDALQCRIADISSGIQTQKIDKFDTNFGLTLNRKAFIVTTKSVGVARWVSKDTSHREQLE